MENSFETTSAKSFLDDVSNYTSSECRLFHSLKGVDVCRFIEHVDSCQTDGGFVNYLMIFYCQFNQVLPLGIFIAIVWWIFLIIGLITAADNFLCPALEVMTKNLGISHNIAGVTLLAFGNGSPDIFSSVAAVGSAKQGDYGLAVGALFGGCIFVTTVVAGTVIIAKPFKCMERPFLRDVCYYLIVAFLVLYFFFKREITVAESSGFIVLYVAYVLTVIISRFINVKTREKKARWRINVNSEDDMGDSFVNEAAPLIPLIDNAFDTDEQKNFLTAICPIDLSEWNNMSKMRKAFEVIKAPSMFILLMTVPVVNVGDDGKYHNWNRKLNALHCLISPVTAAILTKGAFKMISRHFPAIVVVVVVGFLTSVFVYKITTDAPPKFHAAFGYVGFVISVIWSYSTANEIVNLLQAFGVTFNISDAVLGLTVLAWGNSISDLIADRALAKQGYPRMAISACFGGTLLNLLLGIGIPLTFATIKNGGQVKIELTLIQVVLMLSLLASLGSSLFLVVVVFRFDLPKCYGIYLYTFYTCFLTVALLVELNVIRIDV